MIGYAALREAAAWRDVSARGRIRVTGEDRARLLHAMTTNHVEQLQPGQGCYAFFLSAQGRVLADVNLFCRPDHFLLDTEPETADKVREHLDHFIIADDVTVEDIAAGTVAIAVEGPRAAEALRKAGAPAPGDEFASELWGERLVANVSYAGLPGWLVVAPVGEREDVVGHLKAAGAIAAGDSDFHAVRLEMGRPRYGEDIGERYLAQETNQLRAIHFQKGCYLGQEIVERVRSRAQIHRLLMPVRIEGADVPAPGTKLQAEGRDAAEITSAAYSPALGQVVALAYVRSEHARPGAVLELAGRRAVVR
ncbi:MAG: glycine cleavage T C-terminal barrel domain-containing protein [Bryobacteraceae bacterium]